MKSIKTEAMALAICVAFLAMISGAITINATTQSADKITEVLTQQEQYLQEQYLQGNDSLKNEAALFPDLPIVKSFPSPTKYPRGLTYDGVYLYVAQAATEDIIYKIDPKTGDVVNTYEWTYSTFPIGLAWDGVNFYVSDDTSGYIYVVDKDFNLVKKLPAPETWQRDMAYDGTNLLEVTSYTNKIWTLDTDDGSVIDVFSSPLDWPAGLAWDGTYIWHSNSEFLGPRDYIYKLDTDGTVLEQYNSPGTYPTGLAFDGQYLWCVDWDTDTIYQLDIGFIPPSPTVTIETDKFKYCPCDTMNITVEISNPTNSSVTFKWFVGIPQFEYWKKIHSMNIPAGYHKTFTVPLHVEKWGEKPFSLVWYVDLQDPKTGQVLAADVVCCAYCPTCGKGEVVIPTSTPSLWSTEIEEEIENVV